MSPLTVAITTVPFFSSVTPDFSSSLLITANDSFAASAAIKSCGRYAFFCSKSLPIMSSAGIIFLFMISIAESFSPDVPAKRF